MRLAKKPLCLQTPIAFPDSSSALQILFIIYMKGEGKHRTCLEMLVEMEVFSFA